MSNHGTTKKALFHSFVLTKWDKTKFLRYHQIDALRPLFSRTIIRAARITGAVPVGHYYPIAGGSLRPHKSIPSSPSRRALTIRSSLKGKRKRYYSYSLVWNF